MVVNPSVPAKSVPDFIAYAKANPGKINMAPAGTGNAHIFGELFKMMTGVDMVTVHYRGAAPALTDLLGGQVQVMFDPWPGHRVHQSGQASRTGGDGRDAIGVLPDIPTVGEFVPGYEASGSGLRRRRNTSAEIIGKLNMEISAALADPKIRARLADLGARRFRSRRPILASSSSTKPRSGPR